MHRTTRNRLLATLAAVVTVLPLATTVSAGADTASGERPRPAKQSLLARNFTAVDRDTSWRLGSSGSEVPLQKWSTAGHAAARNPFKMVAMGKRLRMWVAPDNGNEGNGTELLIYQAKVRR